MSPIEPDLPAGLVSNPAAPMPVAAFTGFLGHSHTQGHVRLYLDEELRDWFDVAEEDVLGTRRLEGPLPRTMLWVDQRTTLHRRQTQPFDVHGGYLDGDLAAETVGQTAMHVLLEVTAYIRLSPLKPWKAHYDEDPAVEYRKPAE